MSTGANQASQGGGAAGATSTGGGSTGATSATTGGGSAGSTGSGATSRTTFKVTKPTMGEVLQVDKDTYVAVVGGKPNSGWTALESPMDTSKVNAYQHRPTSTTASGKGQSRREEGQKTVFAEGTSDLPTFIYHLDRHLVANGMDTIAHLTDPVDNTRMTNCVIDYPRFTTSTTAKMIVGREALYDSYDKKNDDEAIQHLLNSLDGKLAKKLIAACQGKLFVEYFAEFIAIVRRATADQVKLLKERIQGLKPANYQGENLDEFCLDLKVLVDELIGCDAYDHNLTKDICIALVEAGGRGPLVELFHYQINAFHLELSKELEATALMDGRTAMAHMTAKHLLPSDLMSLALKEYRAIHNANKWAPAVNSKHLSGALPVANLVPQPSNKIQGFANALIQAMSRGSDTTPPSKSDKGCFHCGEVGHYKAVCPKLQGKGREDKVRSNVKPGRGNYKSQRNNPGRRGNTAWKTTPPGVSDPHERTEKGRKFYWCEKCKRWTTSHTTATHIKKGDTTPAANLVPDFGNFAWHAPFPSHYDASRAPTSPIWLTIFVSCIAAGVSHVYPCSWLSGCLSFGISWILMHWPMVLPVLLWLGLLAVTLLVPWLATPEPHPDPGTRVPSRYARRHEARTRRKLSKHSMSARNPGATRLGYHRQFPLRCRRENLHVTQPPPSHRWEAPRLSTLVSMAHEFRLRLHPLPTPCGEGGNACKNTFHKRSSKNWSRNRKQPQKKTMQWVRNENNEWIRATLPDPSKNPFNQAKRQPTCRQFLTKKAYANFHKILEPYVYSSKHETQPPKRHFRTPAKSFQDIRVQEVPLNKRQWRSFEDIIGSAKYFAFVAQDGIPDNLLTLAAEARATFHAGKATHKVMKLPVVWDSGASICVSFDKNDFVGPIQPVPTLARLRGFFRNGPRIRGIGHIAWSFTDVNGMLRTLKLPALYVPDVKQRLLSITRLLQAYPDEHLVIEEWGMRLSGDGATAPVEVLNDTTTNLPTAYAQAHGTPDTSPGLEAYSTPFPVASTLNANLTDAQRELVRWHQRLGHVGYRRVQFLLRSGVLSHTEHLRRLHTKAGKLSYEGCPLCAACQFGKQRRRSLPSKRTHVVKETVDALRKDHLFPGQKVSVDHFICSTRGRLLKTKGKESENEKYSGGCIFVDHASGHINVEMQVHVTTAETIKSKLRYEQLCRDHGVIPQEYHTDRGSVFTSEEFHKHLQTLQQQITYAGTGAHHHNGIAERAIQTVMSSARTMMLHAAIHWPEAANTQLWPLAVHHAVYLHNNMPSDETGLSPNDLFTRTKHPSKRFSDLHPLFCPAYALDKRIADGHKLPRWTPRSDRYIFVGFSDQHASSVPLLLNPRTGSIVSNFHVVFDDWFSTVSTSVDNLPDFGTDEWNKLFGDSKYQYIVEEDDKSGQFPSENHDDDDASLAAVTASRSATIAKAQDQYYHTRTSSHVQSSTLNPTVGSHATTASHHKREERSPSSPPSRLLVQRENLPSVAPTPSLQREESSVLPSSTSLSTMPPQQKEKPSSTLSEAPTSTPPTFSSEEFRPATSVPEHKINPKPKTSSLVPELRRSLRSTRAPDKLTYDILGSNQAGHCLHFSTFLCRSDFELAAAFKANDKNPDTLTFDEALNDEHKVNWLKAAADEIRSLEDKDCWDEVPISEATSKILPGTWTFRRKRSPDGEVTKYKARFCVRGDLQEGEFETFAPVVAWGTVRLFLTLSLILEWRTVSIDFASAFVQASLQQPVWIHLPRGFRSCLGQKTCLRLKKSLYGLSMAPRLWFNHLFEALLHSDFGLTQSKIDPCFLTSSHLMVVCFVDDLGVSAKSETVIDTFVSKLRRRGFELDIEGSFEQYLGIKFERNVRERTVEMTQKGLITKIISTMGLEDCKPNLTPASQIALGRDENGEPMKESWSYPSIVGMLLYLSTNTRPDISFAVSQVGRFSSNPRQSHATAVKTIVRYLAGTKDKGLIMKPRGDLKLEMFCDADFAGLYKCESDRSLDSARSRTGYIIKLSGCPLIWKSHLQTEVALSTLEAEYSALSQALRTMLPLKRMLVGAADLIRLPPTVQATISADVFEDNQGCLALATNHRLTSRTKYFHVKYHWFWYHYKVHREFEVSYVQSSQQDADYLTKQLPKDVFKANRHRVQGW